MYTHTHTHTGCTFICIYIYIRGAVSMLCILCYILLLYIEREKKYLCNCNLLYHTIYLVLPTLRDVCTLYRYDINILYKRSTVVNRRQYIFLMLCDYVIGVAATLYPTLHTHTHTSIDPNHNHGIPVVRDHLLYSVGKSLTRFHDVW